LVIGDWWLVAAPSEMPFVGAISGAVWVFAFAIVWENNAVMSRF